MIIVMAQTKKAAPVILGVDRLANDPEGALKASREAELERLVEIPILEGRRMRDRRECASSNPAFFHCAVAGSIPRPQPLI
jgi:hypothetical protein